MHRHLLAVVIVATAVCGWMDDAYAASDWLMRDVRALHRIDRDIALPEEKIGPLEAGLARIAQRIGAQAPASVPDADLQEWFLASALVSFYSSSKASTRQMATAFAELEKRGLSTTSMRRKMLDAYVAARMLDEAQTFASDPANAGLNRLPVFRDNDAVHQPPTLWTLSGDGRTLTRHDFPLSSEPRLIVVSSPWCGFSRNASDEIAQDAGLADLMKRHSTWVMPQFIVPDFAGIAQWNHDRPAMPTQLVHENAEWPWITSWGTPGFYFLKDGKVVKTVTGWPGPERLAELRAGFDAIGVR